jgi:hypothetical protein
MNTQYGVIGSGTTPDRLILWGAGFPVIELAVDADDELPRMTIVGDEISGSGSLEIEFSDTLAVLSTNQPHQAYEEPLRQAEGWQVGTAINGGCGLYVIDPAERYHFELIATDRGLLIYLRDSSVEDGLRLMTFSCETLQAKGAWPVLPVADASSLNPAFELH